MKVTPNTRISELIKWNEESIDAIASLAKPLRRLRNPLLRRIMASRVTITEAAAIGGCSVADFRQALEPLGFIFLEEQDIATTDYKTPNHQPDWLSAIPDDNIDYFDVRPIIQSGDDPLKAIIERYSALPTDSILCITNSFIPYPLIHLLEKKGAKSFVESPENNLYQTWFLKKKSSSTSNNTKINMHDADSFESFLAQHNTADFVRIDVRDLPMPQPMEMILTTLSTLSKDKILWVQHKRIPLHLLEELQESNFSIHIHEVSEGDVQVVILHKMNEKQE